MGGENTKRISILEWLLIVVYMALASVLFFVGTYTASMSILEHWKSYGYPFECHCEGIWNTCKCSGDHAGMVRACSLQSDATNATIHRVEIRWPQVKELLGLRIHA